jgi:hypothetical protein
MMRRSYSTFPTAERHTVHQVSTTGMRKTIVLIVLVTCLSACGVVSTLVDGLKFAKAVESDLEEVTGVRPAVAFNWNNGRLTSVTVSFPLLYDEKPLRELAAATRAAVGKEFKQTPENIVLAFSLGATSGTTAQLEQH